MYMIIYNKINGYVLAKIDESQTFENYCKSFPQEMIDYLSYTYLDNVPLNYKDYKIINDEFVAKTEEELNPLQPYNLDNSKDELINLSKTQLTNYLETNPLLFSDGKYYSVTQEKQNLLNNAITVYQMKTQLGLPAELKWNSTGEECSVWAIEDIIPLALGVASYVEPLVSYQQSIEVEIRNCATREELESIVIDYETV